MKNIKFIFSPSILDFEFLSFLLVIISVIIMIIITIFLVKKELKKRGIKIEK